MKVLYGSKVSASVQYSEEASVILVPSYESRERRKWPRVRLSSLVSRAFFLSQLAYYARHSCVLG